MRVLVFAILAVTMVGCAAPSYNYRPESLDISEPPIGSVNTAYVGDAMLRQGKYVEHDSIYVSQKIDVSWAYELLPGYYLKKGEDNEIETYLPGGAEPGAVQKAALADPWSAVAAYKGENRICVITVFNLITCAESPSLTRKKAPVLSDESFQQTLIYSGKIGSKINIGYREFSNNRARPAFNNEVRPRNRCRLKGGWG